jgi:dihydroxyacetone kinase-like predicted kinase
LQALAELVGARLIFSQCHNIAGHNCVEVFVHTVAPVKDQMIVPVLEVEIVMIQSQGQVWIVQLETPPEVVVNHHAHQATNPLSKNAKVMARANPAVTNAFLTKTARPDTASLIQAQTPQ